MYSVSAPPPRRPREVHDFIHLQVKVRRDRGVEWKARVLAGKSKKKINCKARDGLLANLQETGRRDF